MTMFHHSLIVLSGMLLWWPLIVSAAEPSSSSGFRYDAKGRRDPFDPLVINGRIVRPGGGAASQDTSMPSLEGIVWDATSPMALINGTEAKVGDVINGYEIVEIRRDAVVVTNGGQPVVLQIAFESARPEATKGGERQ